MRNFMSATPNPLNDCPFWEGDVLVTMSEISPQQRWPWTRWVQITDCFLRAADNTHPAGSTGGAWEVTQTVAQMPKHDHYVGGAKSGASAGINFPAWHSVLNSDSGGAGGRYYPLNVTESGKNQPMPIVNKYTAFYMWRRTG